MPLYMDRHEVAGASAADVAAAHAADVGVQQRYGVRYLTYWFEEDSGAVFCLAEGPSLEAVEQVHREAHGLIASTVIEVQPGPVNAFFGVLPQYPTGTPYEESAVRAVLFTDICGSTELTSTLGDEAGRALVRDHDAIVRRALSDYDGREVKHVGDGIMASFASVARAVEAAIEIQRSIEKRNDNADTPIDLRIGISAGEPITEGGDLFGSAVQLASRLCTHCEAGSIVVSVAVRELCVGKQLPFVDGGTVELKGFTEPVRVYEVNWR